MNFSTERFVASFYPQGLFELNVHKSLERTLAFSKCSDKPKFIQLFGHIPKHALERIVFKESLVSVPRLINNTLIFLVLMLTALAIKLRWYAEVLSSSSQNWKTHPTISAKCSIQIKINLSSRFNMIWNGAHLKPEEEIQREQLHRNKARDWTAPCFNCVLRYAVTQDVFGQNFRTAPYFIMHTVFCWRKQ